MPAIIVVGKSVSWENNFAGQKTCAWRQTVFDHPSEAAQFIPCAEASGSGSTGAGTSGDPHGTGRAESGTGRGIGAVWHKCRELACVHKSDRGGNIFEQLEKQAWDVRKLFRKQTDLRIAAIGSATGQALRPFGLIPDLVPDVYDAEHLGTAIAREAKPGSEVLIVRAKDGSETLLPPLEDAGLSVQDVALYETVCELHEALHDEIVNTVRSGAVDAVTFTSASTVRGFVQSMKLTDYTEIHAVCIGRQTAKEAERYGMQVQISDQATIDSLTEKICSLYGKEA